MGEPLVFLAPGARKKGAGQDEKTGAQECHQPSGGPLLSGRAIFRTRPTSRKGGFYLHRVGSPLGGVDPRQFPLRHFSSHRTSAHAVARLLNDPEWAKWSDREMARACNVGADLVGVIRRELKPILTVGSDSEPRTYTTKQRLSWR
jgi:hypothetical protein